MGTHTYRLVYYFRPKPALILPPPSNFCRRVWSNRCLPPSWNVSYISSILCFPIRMSAFLCSCAEHTFIASTNNNDVEFELHSHHVVLPSLRAIRFRHCFLTRCRPKLSTISGQPRRALARVSWLQLRSTWTWLWSTSRCEGFKISILFVHKGYAAGPHCCSAVGLARCQGLDA